MQGWVKLHRELMEKPIWESSTLEQKVILITLMMMANHKEKEWEFNGQKYVAKPGQFVTSLESIAKKAGQDISIKNVRTALKRFENYGFLANQSTNRNRLITIVNWELYQSKDDEVASQTASNGQATGKQRATNKNVRKKECKKKQYAEFVSLEETEYNKLVVEHGEPAVKEMIRILDNYKGSTGKTYKNDYRAILNWVVNRYQQEHGRNNTIPTTTYQPFDFDYNKGEDS